MVEKSLEAAEILHEEGIECTVVDMHTIKPIDVDLLAELADECGCFVSAEDHSVIGGLGSSISEWLVTHYPAPLEMVGVRDRFGESGSSEELMAIMGLNSDDICEAVRKSYGRKNHD